MDAAPVNDTTAKSEAMLRRPVAWPREGRPVQLALGERQVVLERRFGGVLLVSHDGAQVTERVLGLPQGGGHLELEARPPDHPLELELTTDILLLGGGRVRGYLPLPVHWHLMFHGLDGSVRLQSFAPPGLRLLWRDGGERGGYALRCSAPLVARPGGPVGDASLCWLPVRIQNRGFSALRPPRLELRVVPEELWVARGRILARPRRFVLGVDGSCTQQVVAAPRRRHRAPVRPGLVVEEPQR